MIALLLALFAITEKGFLSCNQWTPYHSSGVHVSRSSRPFTPKDVRYVFAGVASPSLSIDWTGSRSNKQVIEEFLRFTKGKDRRLQLYLRTSFAGEHFENAIDALVAFLFSTNQFNPEAFNPSEISLCLRRDDTLSDYKFFNAVSRARNVWPWFLCRNPAQSKTVRYTAGADNLNLSTLGIKPGTLGSDEFLSLEFSIANVGSDRPAGELLTQFRRYSRAGAVDIAVWWGRGRAAKYRDLIRKLDTIAYSGVPRECRDSNGQVIKTK